jgi:MoaA/NifB/PqqE/SkfB family radical SAM enzyme
LSDGFQNLIDEIATFGQTQRIFITGGEPLLYNNFPNLLNSLTDAKSIVFFTGLGVDPTRFSTQLKKITNKKNLQVVVSAENCEKFYEFNRYGNSWNNFLLNLEELKKQQFSFHFSTVLSNLTLFGLVEFVNKFSDYTFQHEFCGDPDFLNVNVLDKTSKQLLTAQLESSNILFKDELISALNQPCTPNQRQDLSTYITKFVAHRTLSLDIFPKHFCKWLQDVD